MPAAEGPSKGEAGLDQRNPRVVARHKKPELAKHIGEYMRNNSIGEIGPRINDSLTNINLSNPDNIGGATIDGQWRQSEEFRRNQHSLNSGRDFKYDDYIDDPVV